MMQNNAAPQRVMVNEHSLWDAYAKAQQLRVEGDRLIAQKIAQSTRGLRRRLMRGLDRGQRRHLPRI